MSVADQSAPVANQPRRVPFTVRFSPQFINRLCTRLQKSAPPRSDVAGLLFGHSGEDLLEVQVFKSFPETEGEAPPPTQPVPSNATRDDLHRMVEALVVSSRNDPEVSALELVGWYSFRPAGGLHESDVAFHNRYFRQPTEIALILRPEQHPNVLFELYSRSGLTLLSEEEHRWGSLRHATDTAVAGPIDVTMRAKISDDFYLRAYHVGKTLDRAQRRDHWMSAMEATKTTVGSLFRSKPKPAAGLKSTEAERGLKPVDPPKDKQPGGRAAVFATPPPLARAAAAAAVSEPPAESKPTALFNPTATPPTATPPTATPPAANPAPATLLPPTPLPAALPISAPAQKAIDRKPIDREPAAPRDRSAPSQKIRAGDPPSLPAVIKDVRHSVPWLSSAAVAALMAGLTFAGFYVNEYRSGGDTPRFLRAIFPDTGLGLRLEGQGDRVLLSWNRHNAVVRSAKEALLHIDDGAQHRDIRLSAAQAANGAVLYRPGSDDVTFRLEIHGAEGTSVADTMRVLDGAKAQPVAANAPPDVTGSVTGSVTPSGTPAATPVVVTGPSRSSQQDGGGTTPYSRTTSRAPYQRATPSPNPAARANVPDDRAPASAAATTPLSTSAVPPPREEAAAAPPSSSIPAESRPQGNPTQTAGDTVPRSSANAPQDASRQPDTAAKVSNWEDTSLARPAAARDPRPAEPIQTRPAANLPPVQSPTPAAITSRQPPIFVPPRPTKQVLPDLRAAGGVGSTSQIEVAVRVNKKGHVTEAYLVGDSASVNPRLARAALGAAKQWTFDPATLHGKTVPSDHTIVFEFRPAGR